MSLQLRMFSYVIHYFSRQSFVQLLISQVKYLRNNEKIGRMSQQYHHNINNKKMKRHHFSCQLSDPTLFAHSMTLKGFHQAQRNDSEDIWSLFCGEQRKCELPPCTCESSMLRTNSVPLEGHQLKQDDPKGRKKSVSFRDDQPIQKGNKSFELSRPANSGRDQAEKSPKKSRKSTAKLAQTITQPQNVELTPQQLQQRQRYLRECYSIQKYLQSNKAYTRTMPNSAIRLFYEKPCLQSYGRKNTSGNDGFIYNNYLKTHNMQPHRHENDPKKYQTYRSALNFGKRTKMNLQERWKKIHRQMVSKLDMKALVEDFAEGYIPVDGGNVQEMLKFNINTLKPEKLKKSKSLDYLNRTAAARSIAQTINSKVNKNDMNSTVDTSRLGQHLSRKGQIDQIMQDEDFSRTGKLKRSKSWGKKEYLFLYQYKNADGNVQYAKDRHGITCYVDPTFQQNKQTFINFNKRRAPIQAEGVRPQDRNIEQQMIANHIIAVQEDKQSHYLMRNCDEPYRPQKYSFKARRKSIISQTQVLR